MNSAFIVWTEEIVFHTVFVSCCHSNGLIAIIIIIIIFYEYGCTILYMYMYLDLKDMCNKLIPKYEYNGPG